MDDIWLRAVGDDDYVAAVKYEKQRKRLSEILQSCIKTLINEAFTDIRNPEPGLVTDSLLQALLPFSGALERILKHGLKNKVERLRLSANKTSFWYFLENIEKIVPSSSKSISKLKNLQKVKSADGKGRAWIRLMLNENLLEHYLSTLVSNKDLTSAWYEPYAFLVNHSYTSFFTSSLVGLNGLKFSLTVDDLLLDITEPDEELSPVTPTSKQKKEIQKEESECCSN